MDDNPHAELATVASVIRARRTIQAFKPEKPPTSVIHSAIETACWAPNHHLTEPWRFYLLGEETASAVVTLNTELVEHAKGAAVAAVKQQRWSAVPGWLAVTCHQSSDPQQTQEDYAACCCAVQNLQLTLWEQGIGTKWITGAVTHEARFYELLWIDPALESMVGLIWYGYPDEQPTGHRKPLELVLVELP